MARQVVQKSMSALGGLNPQMLYDGAQNAVGHAIKDSPSSDYRVDRIADLKRIIAGDKSPDDHRSRQREMLQYLEKVDEARLDSLKSVALGRKVVMLSDGRADRYRRMRQMEAEWELAELEDNLFKFPWGG